MKNLRLSAAEQKDYMRSSYNFDGHKLVYHLGRVNEFMKKGDCFPLYMEISPSGSCNNRCIFCAYDYIGYPDRKIETDRLLGFISEIAECGVKSLLFGGEGEPLLHPDIDKFINHAKNNGIDVGIFTNGQLLRKNVAEKILSSIIFVRFSFNGGTKENYSKIHRVKQEAFDEVLENIEYAVHLRNEKGLTADIGAQYVLLPENRDYLIDAINILKNIGIDYLAIKPFVQQNSDQEYQMGKQFDLSELSDVLSEAESLSDTNFKVVARVDSIENYGERNYSHCFGTSFISVLNSAGDIATCLPYWEKKDFVFGNIYKNSFNEIWTGEKRKEIKAYLENNLDTNVCPPNCRPNSINEFLWEIKNPTVKHLNFV